MSPQASLASASVALQNASQHLALQEQVVVEPAADPTLADNAERTAQRLKAVHQQALEEAVQDAVAVLREGLRGSCPEPAVHSPLGLCAGGGIEPPTSGL